MIKGEAFIKYMEILQETISDFVVLITNDDGSIYFSGTVFHGNDRKFIITAKHCLKDISNTQTIRVSSTKNNLGCRIRKPSCIYLEDIDLGLIYLTEEQYCELRVKARGISAINSNSAGQKKDIYTIGFPSQIVEQKNKIYHPKPFFYRSIVSERYPSKDEFSDNSERKYFFVEWDETDTTRLDNDRIQIIKLQGISGAGVYTTIPLDENSQVWDFTNLEFAGIISSVNTTARLIKCVRSEYIFKLLGARLEFKLNDEKNKKTNQNIKSKK